jgi:hypothetical protein
LPNDLFFDKFNREATSLALIIVPSAKRMISSRLSRFSPIVRGVASGVTDSFAGSLPAVRPREMKKIKTVIIRPPFRSGGERGE